MEFTGKQILILTTTVLILILASLSTAQPVGKVDNSNVTPGNHTIQASPSQQNITTAGQVVVVVTAADKVLSRKTRADNACVKKRIAKTFYFRYTVRGIAVCHVGCKPKRKAIRLGNGRLIVVNSDCTK